MIYRIIHAQLASPGNSARPSLRPRNWPSFKPRSTVYVVDESEPNCKFGFAYGTLPGHVESGEERFLIEWNRADNSVWYDILAFSKPNHFLTRLGYPVVRRMQKRFARDSAAAMLNAVRSGDGVGPVQR